MAGVADIQAMLDDIYGVAGVAAAWTPAGGAQVLCTALLLGGDQAARLRGMLGAVNVAARCIKLRVAEIGPAAPGDPEPGGGDQVTLGSDLATPLDQQTPYLISGSPRREDPRRLEWSIDLDDA